MKCNTPQFRDVGIFGSINQDNNHSIEIRATIKKMLNTAFI